MNQEYSLSLTDKTEKILKENPLALANKKNWSDIINRAIVIDDHVSKNSLPQLTNNEWGQMLGSFLENYINFQLPPYNLADDLLNGVGIYNENAHPNPSLIHRLSKMSQAEQYAILVFIEKYRWTDLTDYGDFDTVKSAITT